MRKASGRRQSVGWLLVLALVAGSAPARCPADILGGDFKFNGVFRFDDKTGAEVPGGIPSGTPSGGGDLQATAGVTVGPDGNIYVASQNTGEVLFYNGKTGAPLPSPLPGGRDGLFSVLPDNDPNDEQFPAPGPLRFGPDGNLYVADFGGFTVRRIHGTTGVDLGAAATGLGPPGGLTFAPNGDLYVGNYGTSAIIRVHNGVQQTFIASGTGPILTPSSMLFLPNGDMLVVSMFANEIHRYSAAGAYLGLFAAIAPVPPPVDVTNYPSDIGFDADGNVIVAVLGATNPPDNRGQILRYALNEGSVAGTLLDTLVDAYPPMSSVAWIRSPDAITGDYDSDGAIDADDYNKWRSDVGKWVAKGGGADGNGNGVVDAADFVVWRNAMAAGTGAAVALWIVPEPSTALNLLLGVSLGLAALIRRRVSQRHLHSAP
jgi:hypothetical protein